ncbi:MAG: hypothetical protein ACRDK7_01965 [Solirubrobacteraceae bacterium]
MPGGTGNQAYRYDSSTHVVQCVSCASGYDPHPALEATFAEPGNSHPANGVPLIHDASENGDFVFFDSPSALVPADVDGESAPVSTTGEYPSTAYSLSSDVYEWRAYGIDGCEHVQGCLALISSGDGGYMNLFLGASASGRDVFFATHAQLVEGDRDGAGDIYDARIDGGLAGAPASVAECEAGDCQTPAAEQIDSTPGSLTFTAPGEGKPAVARDTVPVRKHRKVRKHKKRKRKAARHARRVRRKAGGR